jgi:hypothetical protein
VQVGARDHREPVGAVIVPAHDESAVIGRLLAAITQPGVGTLDIVVVCNGCQDDTAAVAQSFGVRVLETPVPSKIHALRIGDAAVQTYPRLYVDADVEIERASLDALIEVLRTGSCLAAGPQRVIPRAGVSPLIRAYYAAWEELPAVKGSLWGRGVVGFARAARDRVATMPDAMSDDLALSLLFAPEERVVLATATVVVHPPRTLAALLVRKERSVVGNRQLRAVGIATESDRTRPRDLLTVGRQSPRHAVGTVVLVGVALAARLRARRHSPSDAAHRWGRDDTSRVELAG